MAKLSIAPGSTSVSLLVFIQDSASTVGAGKTSLAYNTASLTCYYVRPGAAAASISLVTETVTGAWSSGGFVEIDATNMPGIYRVDVPNAVLAAGVRSAVVMLKGASGMAPLVLEIDLGAQVIGVEGNVNGSVLVNVVGNVEGGVGGNVAGSVMGDVEGDVRGSVSLLADNAITSTSFHGAALTAIADAILKRDWTGLTGEAARSLLNAGRFVRNKWSIIGSTLTVTKEDDSTPAWTATLTSDAGADPVTGSDPA